MEEDTPLAIEPVGAEGVPLWILEAPARALEITGDRGTQKSDLALGRETLVEKDIPLAIEPVGVEGVPLWILEAPASAVETTGDRGTRKSHFALCREALAEGYGALTYHSICLETLGKAPRQGEPWYVCIVEAHRLLDETGHEVERAAEDCGLEVECPHDPGSPDTHSLCMNGPFLARSAAESIDDISGDGALLAPVGPL